MARRRKAAGGRKKKTKETKDEAAAAAEAEAEPETSEPKGKQAKKKKSTPAGKKRKRGGKDADEEATGSEMVEAEPASKRQAVEEAEALASTSTAALEALVADYKPPSLNALAMRVARRTREIYAASFGDRPGTFLPAERARLRAKVMDEYDAVRAMPELENTTREKRAKEARLRAAEQAASRYASGTQFLLEGPVAAVAAADTDAMDTTGGTPATTSTGAPGGTASLIDQLVAEVEANEAPDKSRALILATATAAQASAIPEKFLGEETMALIARRNAAQPVPEWHAPWKCMRVISGHTGWVRAVDVDVSNEWFVTGAKDRTIKIWDLASGKLKLTLTGHIGEVRGVAVSDRHPYLFSAGNDKMVKCWDLEQNKTVRSYHGHLSGVMCLAVHPTLDIIITGGRDSVARVWDMRSRKAVHVLAGHKSTCWSVVCQGDDPQVVTGSMDATVRLWDLRKGETMSQLTNHKKGVRGLALHPKEFTFVSAAADNLKKWKFPHGEFLHNFNGHRAIVNAVAVNTDNVLVSGGDNGTLHFWDWKTGYNFQSTESIVQPGSLDAEAGICATTFDKTGSRLITCETDKSIKMWKEDEDATPETHPVNYSTSYKSHMY